MYKLKICFIFLILLILPVLSKFLCLWKCLTVNSSISAFSNFVCFGWPSVLLFLVVDSNINAFNIAKLWFILALLRFSIRGLFVRFNGSGFVTAAVATFVFWFIVTIVDFDDGLNSVINNLFVIKTKLLQLLQNNGNKFQQIN